MYLQYMAEQETNIFLEPDADPETLSNLGPLRPMAGIWEGVGGADLHPAEEGSKADAFVERYELQPIDPQTNGPQLFYGLRYHVHIVKPGEIETFHDQVGYWLWEPATHAVIQTLAIPRAQVAMSGGTAAPDAKEFELHASLGSEIYGICSNPFLDSAFKTTSFRIRVTINDDGTWAYDEDAIMEVAGMDEPFHHTDRNVLRMVAPPTPNPLAQR